MRERLGGDASSRLPLEPVVANGRGRSEAVFDIGGIDHAPAGGEVSPHARVTVRLQFHPDRAGVATGGALVHGAGQGLHMVADFVCDDLGLGELARGAEPRVEFGEEGEVQVHLAITRAIERTHGGLAHAAG